MRFSSLLVVLLSTFLATIAVASELPCVTTQGCIARDDASHAARSDSALLARNKLAPSPEVERVTTAAGIWNKMRNHVMRGRKDMPKSGRHTTSSFFAPEAQHAKMAPSLVVNTLTSFAKANKKTLFIDSVVRRSPATNGVKKWSEATVGAACRSAIQAALRTAGSGKSMKSGSYSIKSPLGGPNLCVYVNYASCWPSGITPSTKPLGQAC
ncbi:hypothetical protein C8Q72DRAFT_574067 [Fomitopsis betulina]|nr:hypothetical protein C8Q72DRAFT_574067 [Fomitopsis betulina]